MKLLTNEIKLPSVEEMENYEENDFTERKTIYKLQEKHSHKMIKQLIWAYDDQLSDLGKMDRISPVVRDLYDYLHELRTKHTVGYKDYTFEINKHDFQLNNPVN